MGRLLALLSLAMGLSGPGPAADRGDIVGRVRLVGPPPVAEMVRPTTDVGTCGTEARPAAPLALSADGGVSNAVVSLATEGLEGWRLPRARFVIDQHGCEFVPRLLVIPPGATVEVRNSDGILHNFHTLSRRNPPRNLGQRPGAPPLKVRFDEPELVAVRCDIHGQGVMRAWIVVAAHPYDAITDASGRFRLPGVVQGPHTLAVWHERLGHVTAPVSVDAGGEVRVEIAYPALRVSGGQR